MISTSAGVYRERHGRHGRRRRTKATDHLPTLAHSGDALSLGTGDFSALDADQLSIGHSEVGRSITSMRYILSATSTWIGIASKCWYFHYRSRLVCSETRTVPRRADKSKTWLTPGIINVSFLKFEASNVRCSRVFNHQTQPKNMTRTKMACLTNALGLVDKESNLTIHSIIGKRRAKQTNQFLST